MKEIVITDKSGITLKTKKTLIDDDIKVKLSKDILETAVPIKVDELPDKPKHKFIYEKDGYLYQAIKSFNDVDYGYPWMFKEVFFVKKGILECMKDLEKIGYDNGEFYMLFVENETYITHYIYDDYGVLRYQKYKYDDETGEDILLNEAVVYENDIWYIDNIKSENEMYLDDSWFPNYHKSTRIYYAYVYHLLTNKYQRPSYLECLTNTFTSSNEILYDEVTETLNLNCIFNGINLIQIEQLEDIKPIYAPTVKKVNLNSSFYASKLTQKIFDTLFEQFKFFESQFNDMSNCFEWCEMDELDLSEYNCKPVKMNYAFYHSRIKKIKGIDLINLLDYNNSIFYEFSELLELELKNINGSLYLYHSTLLSVNSLIGIIKELIVQNETKKLGIGQINIAKLQNVYVRLTDEDEEYEEFEKYPCEVCESTDADAMPIIEYANSKGWSVY